jgi:hypothetical protein
MERRVMTLTQKQRLSVRRLLDLAKAVSELPEFVSVRTLEAAADVLTWEKMQVLKEFGQ